MFRSYYRLSVDWLGSLFHTVPTPEPKLTELTSIFETLMTGGKRTVANFTRSFQTFVQGYTCHLSSHFTDLNNFFKDFIYLFSERGKGREKEKERNINVWENRSVVPCMPQKGAWPATQVCAPTGNWATNLSVCRPALNPLSHTSQHCWP